MSRKQWLHLPLLLVVVVLAIPGCLCALGYRFIMAFITYLHRVYVPSARDIIDVEALKRYAEQDTEFTQALYEAFAEPIICTIPADDHGWTELPGGFSGHVPCNGLPRLDCRVHSDSAFADRPGQKIVETTQAERVLVERLRREAIGCICPVHYFWPGAAFSMADDCPVHGSAHEHSFPLSTGVCACGAEHPTLGPPKGGWRYAKNAQTALQVCERFCAVSGERIKIEKGALIPTGCDCDGTVHPVSLWAC